MKKKIFIILLFLFFTANNLMAESLRTQYVVNYAPLSFEADEKVTGIYVDIVHELNNRLQHNDIMIITKKPVSVPVKRILRNLEEGKIDVILGVTKTREREEIFQYASVPILKPEMTFAKRISDTSEYPDEESLKGKYICSIDGSNSSKNISEIKGIGGMKNAYDIPTCLKVLSMERIDLVYFHNFALLYYIKEMNLNDKITLVKKPFRTKDYYLCFSKKVKPETITEIDKVAASMLKDGTIKKIVDNYR